MVDARRPLVGWAAVARAVTALQGRVERLERDSHPPIDLAPAIDELLAERGYVPLIPHEQTGLDAEDLLHLHERAWAEIEGQVTRRCLVHKAPLRRLLEAYAALAAGSGAHG